MTMQMDRNNSVLRARPFDEFPPHFTDAMERIAQRIADAVTDTCHFRKHHGSYSYRIRARVLGKLLPQDPTNPALYVGFSSESQCAEEYSRRLCDNPTLQLFGAGNYQPFFWAIKEDITAAADATYLVMADFLREAYAETET